MWGNGGGATRELERNTRAALLMVDGRRLVRASVRKFAVLQSR
jgi:hypothetical protein